MMNARVDVMKVEMGVIPCLFFGKRGKIFPLKFKGVGHLMGDFFSLGLFESQNLIHELEEVDFTLEVSHMKHWESENSVCHLPSGVYVHVYGPNTLTCSSVRLSRARGFFVFETSVVTLPKTSSIDVRPFLFANGAPLSGA